jgi:hypothetical protein
MYSAFWERMFWQCHHIPNVDNPLSKVEFEQAQFYHKIEEATSQYRGPGQTLRLPLLEMIYRS